MQALRKYLPLVLFLAFLSLALLAFMSSKPRPKNARVYKAVQQYSPYYLDKRFGGLQIMSKEDKDFIEKPTNMTLFSEFSRLEREWGQTHLKIENNALIILDNNGTTQATLPLQKQEELNFIHSYYEVH